MSMSRKELTFSSGHDTCAAWLAEPRLSGLAVGSSISSEPTCRLASLSLAGLHPCGRSGCQAGPAIEAARQAPKGEFRIYPGVDHSASTTGRPQGSGCR
jgi:hypothetical protein